MIAPNCKILITGAGGMVGQCLEETLRQAGHGPNLLTPRRAELDLEDRAQTRAYFLAQRPEFVFHLAAKVGGIGFNISDPVGFLQANALVGLHVLEACHESKVEKTLVLGSSCMYPRAAPQPMKESDLMTGPLEPTNEGYALAKLVTTKLAQAYHQQFGMQIVCPLASNIYGPNDHFDLQRSHVLSALVKRFSDAARDQASSVTLWGTGSARREFTHVQDVVAGMLFMIDHVTSAEVMNLGPGSDLTIRELSELVREKSGYQCTIHWDESKPDGMPRKCMDVSKLAELGFKTQIPLAVGVEEVLQAYRKLK